MSKQQNPVKKTGNPVLQKTGTVLKELTPKVIDKIQEQGVIQAANKVTEKPKKAGFFKKMMEVAGPVISAVAPEVAGMVPVVGPLLKGALSTLNDDEWFGEFRAAGATFNELLAMNEFISGDATKKYIPLIAGYVQYTTNLLVDKSGAISTWKDTMLPSILAYVRDKTNNVLNGTENDYWNSFKYASLLYAIMYTIKKYVKLTQNLPLNIPALTSQLVVCKPSTYSQWKGIADSLELYLSTNCKLPYAWTEYLRWRFGTTFCSSNTGKPALVFYDANVTYDWDNAYTTPDAVASIIESYKTYIAAAGRAMADINLAFKDHTGRFDVEDRHYDEKEFNLRTNFTAEYLAKNAQEGDYLPGKLLYMDSRLDSSAALQAVTLSTIGSDNYPPFLIVRRNLGFYVVKAFNLKATTNSYTDDYRALPADAGTDVWSVDVAAGWHSVEINSARFNRVIVGIAGGGHAKSEGQSESDVKGGISTMGYIYEVFNGDVEEPTNGDQFEPLLEKYLAYKCLESIEAHGPKFWSPVDQATISSTYPQVFLGIKPLSYDTAFITDSQVSAIHRMAVRNLIRGNYKSKTPINKQADVQTAKADMVDFVKEEMLSEIK